MNTDPDYVLDIKPTSSPQSLPTCDLTSQPHLVLPSGSGVGRAATPACHPNLTGADFLTRQGGARLPQCSCWRSSRLHEIGRSDSQLRPYLRPREGTWLLTIL
jgi:hypothetical protein